MTSRLKIISLVLIFLLIFNDHPAQPADTVSTEKQTPPPGTSLTKKVLTLSAVSSIFAITAVDCYYMWWKDHGKPFALAKHENNTGWLNDPFSRGIDKIGHFYTSYLFYHLQKDALQWGGFSEKGSFWISTGLTTGLALLIEIGDGFSYYAFDYQDLVFNFGGLGFAMLQDKYPFFKNFRFKWSFIPSDHIAWPPHFTEHYNAHIYWLSFDLYNLLGEKYNKYWTKYLNPAVGFSITKDYRREFVIGLDLNISAIFKTDKNSVIDLLMNTSDMLHIPMPGMKFTEDGPPQYKLQIFN